MKVGRTRVMQTHSSISDDISVPSADINMNYKSGLFSNEKE